VYSAARPEANDYLHRPTATCKKILDRHPKRSVEALVTATEMLFSFVKRFTGNPTPRSYSARSRTGVKPMTTTWRKRKAFVIAVATVACTAMLLLVALAFPQPVSDQALGDGWQCRKILFLTSCTRVEQPTPTAQNSHTDRICPRRV
jgi:hypothetical protein